METALTGKLSDLSPLVTRKENGILSVTIPHIQLPAGKKAPPCILPEEILRITGRTKNRIIIDISHCLPLSKETRDELAEKLPELTSAMALVSTTVYGKLVAEIFFTLKPQPYAHRLFESMEKAEGWLLQQHPGG
jgi:hypothetical protein